MVYDVVPEQITLFLIRAIISVLMIHFYINEKKSRFLSLFIGFFVFSWSPIFRLLETKYPFFVYLASVSAFFGLAVIIMGVAVYFYTLSKRNHNLIFIVFGVFLVALFFTNLARPSIITAYFQLAILLWIVLVIVFHYQSFQKKVGPNAWLLFTSLTTGALSLFIMVLTVNQSLYGEHFYTLGAILTSILLGFFIINLETFTSKKELLASEVKFRKFFDEAPLGYQSLDEQGYFLDVNDTWLQVLGYSREQVLGKWFGDFLDPSLVSIFQTRFPLFKEKGFIQTEFNMKRSDGTYCIIAFDGRVSYSQEGQFLRTHCVLKNITEQRRLIEKINQLNLELEEKVKKRTANLERANKDLENVAYSIAHDLKTPLRAIIGFSKLLDESFSKDFSAEGRRFVSIIDNNAKNMNSLINDLLSLARIARSDLKKVKFSFEPMIQQLFTELLMKYKLENVPLTVLPLPEVYGDQSFLKMVLRNLLDNAIKFSIPKENRHITLSGEVINNFTIFKVMDNGVGFNPEYSNKLFQIFQHLHAPNLFSGNGMGLSIVEKIVIKHGGKVWADGILGEGASFYFSLPNKQEAMSLNFG